MSIQDLAVIITAQNQYGKIFDDCQKQLGKIKSAATDMSDSLAQKVSNLGSVMMDLGQGIGVFGDGISKFIASSSAYFSELETGIQKAGGNVRATDEQLGQLRDTIFNIGGASSKSFTEIADAFYQLAGGSVDFDEALSSLPEMVKFAEANLLDMETAALLVTQSLVTFNLEAEDTGSVLDLLTKASQSGMAKLPQLADSFQMAGTYANQFGWSMQDLTGTLVALGDAGVVGSEAGTAIKRALNELASPSKNTVAALNEVGISMDEVAVAMQSPIDMIALFEGPFNNFETSAERVAFASQVFGQGAGPQMAMLLSQGSESLAEYVGDLDGAGGAMDDLKSRLDSAQPPFQALQKQLQEIGFNAGQAVQGPLNEMAAKITPIVAGVSDWVAQNPALVGGLLMAGDAAGKFGNFLLDAGANIKILAGGIEGIQTITKVIKGWELVTKLQTVAQAALNLVMSANPIILIVLAIAALVAGFIYLWNTCEPFRQFWIDLWTGIQAAVQAMIEWFMGIPETIAGIFNAVVGFFQQWGTTILAVVFPIIGIPLLIIQNWESIVAWFSTLPEKIGYALGFLAGVIAGAFVDIWNFITETVPQIIESVVQFFMELPGKIWTWLMETLAWIGNFLSELWNTVTIKVPEIITAVVTFFSGLPGRIWTWLVDTLVKIGTWLGEMWTKITTKIQEICDAVVNFFKELPDKLLQVGKDMIMGLWNGIVSMGGWLMDQINGFISGIIQGFKDGFGEHSPSVIFAEIGKFNILGLQEGMQNAIKRLDIPSMTADVVGGFENGLSMPAYAGAGSIDNSINNSRTANASFSGDIVISSEMDLDAVGQYLAAAVANRIY